MAAGRLAGVDDVRPDLSVSSCVTRVNDGGGAPVAYRVGRVGYHSGVGAGDAALRLEGRGHASVEVDILVGAAAAAVFDAQSVRIVVVLVLIHFTFDVTQT